MVWGLDAEVLYEEEWTLTLVIMTHHQRVEVFIGILGKEQFMVLTAIICHLKVLQ